MHRHLAIATGPVSAITLSGCTETSGPDCSPALSSTPTRFAGMERPCPFRTSGQTGIPANQIVVTNRIQTGGGPLTLDARRTKLGCRTEPGGGVTVFSEFAN